jgi:nicotinamidase-related amidase
MTKALIVIDVQESFRQQPIWRFTANPDIVDKVNRLVDHARAHGDLVVWVQHSEAGTGGLFDPARGYVRLIDGLTKHEGEPMITKTAHNAFTTTNLAQILTERGIRELIVSGIRTEQCCETTARVAADLGYDVTFAVDATTTTPIAHRDAPGDLTPDELVADPRTLQAADVIARTEYALAGRFARISTVDEITGAPALEPVG